MQPFTRYLSLTLIPLLTFLAVAMAGQAWLQKETRLLQADAIVARRAQFVHAVAITNQPPETWDDSVPQELGALLDSKITLYKNGQEWHGPPARAADEPRQDAHAVTDLRRLKDSSAGEARPADDLSFDYAFPDNSGLHARVTFASPATHRLIVLHQRMLGAVVLLALVFIAVSLLFALQQRSVAGPGADATKPDVRSALLGVEHFARLTAEQGKSLKLEEGARHRAEENLQVSRTLLDQSMQARVQLGRNLHDNICQTLYAVSLSLEAVRRTVADNASATSGQRLDQCIAELRRLNHEVRSYLKDLQPDAVQRVPFTDAVSVMFSAQSGAGEPKLIQDLEPGATRLIAPEQTTEVLSILREAMSNSVRHGHATAITLRARRSDESVILAVQDDGPGFDPAASGNQGHGLGNMRARATALGGSLKIISAPGTGTRVLLTLPIVAGIRGDAES